MRTPRPPLAAALALAAWTAASARAATPDLNQDFTGMAQWLSHELAQGLAFSAGSNFDPPREVRGYALQPDLSIGAGRIPFNKSRFPAITTPALNDYGGANLFPDDVLFPNFALHLRMGLPWRGDVYARVADATTPPGYKITPTMTARVQTNSYGFGVRQHFFGGDRPRLTLGAHYNHVRGMTRLKGTFNVNAGGFNLNDEFRGEMDWNLNSYGVTAVVSHSFGPWTPFAGLGYNYTSGSVRTRLSLISSSIFNPDVIGDGSERPEQSQGREIFGVSYDRASWSLFANGEVKALGQLQYRSYIIQFGAALPFEIGGASILRRKGRPAAAARPAEAAPARARSAPRERARPEPPPAAEEAPGVILLR